MLDMRALYNPHDLDLRIKDYSLTVNGIEADELVKSLDGWHSRRVCSHGDYIIKISNEGDPNGNQSKDEYNAWQFIDKRDKHYFAEVLGYFEDELGNGA